VTQCNDKHSDTLQYFVLHSHIEESTDGSSFKYTLMD
jgi:hypothetical protein